jgi:hypothetical protein
MPQPKNRDQRFVTRNADGAMRGECDLNNERVIVVRRFDTSPNFAHVSNGISPCRRALVDPVESVKQISSRNHRNPLLRAARQIFLENREFLPSPGRISRGRFNRRSEISFGFHGLGIRVK